MAEKGEIAVAAAKLALQAATAEDDRPEDAPPEASLKKKLGAGSLGLLAAFYLVNHVIGIIPILSQLHYLMAVGIIWWSLSVWNIRPYKMFKERRERKKLEASLTDPSSGVEPG